MFTGFHSSSLCMTSRIYKNKKNSVCLISSKSQKPSKLYFKHQKLPKSTLTCQKAIFKWRVGANWQQSWQWTSECRKNANNGGQTWQLPTGHLPLASVPLSIPLRLSVEDRYTQLDTTGYFWSAPGIATSGKVQHWKFVIHWLSVTLCMLRVSVKSEKSDCLSTKQILCTCSKNWIRPEVALLGADQKECSPQGTRKGQNYKQQWHNYACPRRSSAGQKKISQLTLIINNPTVTPATAERAWLTLDATGKLPVFYRIQPHSNKFATSVGNKATDDSKLNESRNLSKDFWPIWSHQAFFCSFSWKSLLPSKKVLDTMLPSKLRLGKGPINFVLLRIIPSHF